jgi:hypothetical protein
MSDNNGIKLDLNNKKTTEDIQTMETEQHTAVKTVSD